jgi:hypothetical protein
MVKSVLWEFPGERGFPVQLYFRAEMGCAIPVLSSHVGNNELKCAGHPCLHHLPKAKGVLLGS